MKKLETHFLNPHSPVQIVFKDKDEYVYFCPNCLSSFHRIKIVPFFTDCKGKEKVCVCLGKWSKKIEDGYLKRFERIFEGVPEYV